MRYYFKLSESRDRMDAIMRGEIPSPIHIYAETPAIIAEYEQEHSDLWGISKYNSFSSDIVDFATKEEAEAEYYAYEADDVYCQMHDC